MSLNSDGRLEGVILKGIGSFYTVKTSGGLVVCRPRGKFRLEKLSPLPGDRVMISLLPDGTGWLSEILPRSNCFVRPPVCNIGAIVMVVSEAVPVSSTFLIDRMTVMCQARGIETIICINKCDIASGETLYGIYSDAGFKTIRVRALEGEGLDELSAAIAGKTVAFTGNSGVGKSTLLNALDPDFVRETGDISDKLGRGRHTTRHAEFFTLPCGAIAADTPGFSALDAESVDKESLDECFIDFKPYLGNCRFTGCGHIGVADCAVIQAVGDGAVRRERYESYVRLMQM